MRKLISFAFVLVVFVAFFARTINPVHASGDFWTTRTPMGAARTDLGVVAVGGEIYAIGGSAPGGDTANTNQVYDPATDTWTSKAPMPGLRADFGAAVYEDEIYVMGGKWFVAGGVLDSVWVYDPSANVWASKASMPTARMGVQANLADGKIYVIGGQLDDRVIVNSTLINKMTDVNEAYDPSADTWIVRASIPTSVCYYASAVSGGKVYIIGGYTNAANSTSLTPVNLNQIYDPITDSWSLGAPIPQSVLANAAATTGVMAPRRIYVIGEGLNQVYDSQTDTWTVGAPMPNEDERLKNFGPASVAVDNDLLYVIGGVYEGDNNQLHSSNFQYTPMGYGTPDSPTPSPTQNAQDLWSSQIVIIAIACTVAAIALAAGLLVYFRKLKAKIR
jgi:N-acetylneuraminic acid mutarotase